MAQIKALLGKIRIEFFAIGLFFLTLIVFSARLYVCRFDGAVIAQIFYFNLPLVVGPFVRLVILDACFATVGFMAFEKGFTKHAKLAFKIGFAAAAALFLLDLVVVLANSSTDATSGNLFFGRAEFSGGTSVLTGGFGLGFYFYIVLLLVYGTVAFLHPGYAGADEPTLWAWTFRKLNKRDPLLLVREGADPVLSMNVPLAAFYTVITFGVYYYVWMFHLIKAMRKVMNDASSPTGDFLLSALVLPGLQILFALNMKKYEEYLFAHREGLGLKKGDNALLYLLLTIFGFGIVAVILMQLDLNKTVATVTREQTAQPAA